MAFKMTDPPYGVDNTPIYSTDMDDNILGMAQSNGTILVNKNVSPSELAKNKTIEHEKVHIDQMKRGDLDYTDNDVIWKGKKYSRSKMQEGDKDLPWEKEAYSKQNCKSPLTQKINYKKMKTVKKSPTKQLKTPAKKKLSPIRQKNSGIEEVEVKSTGKPSNRVARKVSRDVRKSGKSIVNGEGVSTAKKKPVSSGSLIGSVVSKVVGGNSDGYDRRQDKGSSVITGGSGEKISRKQSRQLGKDVKKAIKSGENYKIDGTTVTTGNTIKEERYYDVEKRAKQDANKKAIEDKRTQTQTDRTNAKKLLEEKVVAKDKALEERRTKFQTDRENAKKLLEEKKATRNKPKTPINQLKRKKSPIRQTTSSTSTETKKGEKNGVKGTWTVNTTNTNTKAKSTGGDGKKASNAEWNKIKNSPEYKKRMLDLNSTKKDSSFVPDPIKIEIKKDSVSDKPKKPMPVIKKKPTMFSGSDSSSMSIGETRSKSKPKARVCNTCN